MIRKDLVAEMLVEDGKDIIDRLVRASDQQTKEVLGRQLLDAFTALGRLAIQAMVAKREAAND